MASATANHHKRHTKPPEASRCVSLRNIVKQRLNVLEFARINSCSTRNSSFAAHQFEYKHQVRPQLGANRSI
jgi:hypothetical protein